MFFRLQNLGLPPRYSNFPTQVPALLYGLLQCFSIARSYNLSSTSIVVLISCSRLLIIPPQRISSSFTLSLSLYQYIVKRVSPSYIVTFACSQNLIVYSAVDIFCLNYWIIRFIVDSSFKIPKIRRILVLKLLQLLKISIGSFSSLQNFRT